MPGLYMFTNIVYIAGGAVVVLSILASVVYLIRHRSDPKFELLDGEEDGEPEGVEALDGVEPAEDGEPEGVEPAGSDSIQRADGEA